MHAVSRSSFVLCMSASCELLKSIAGRPSISILLTRLAAFHLFARTQPVSTQPVRTCTVVTSLCSHLPE